MKSIYLRNFTATAVLVLTCFLLVAFSCVSIGRIYLIREYKSTMENSAQEVARAAEAISQEMLSGGTTLLFVSHDAEMVKRMCRRAVWLNDGVMMDIGEAAAVCDNYRAAMEANA